MASVEKRGPYWRVKVRRKGYPEQTRSFNTKALADKWARDVERDIDRNLFVDRTEADKNTLKDLIERYMREVTPTKRSRTTEASFLAALMRRPIAEIRMSALSSAHISAYRDARLRDVAAGTVNKELNHIGHVIETGRREWNVQLPENPVRLVRRPKNPRARDRRFVDDEEARLFEACEDARNTHLRPVIRLALETGMRRGEILSLLWKHVDLNKRVAYLPETKNGESRGVPPSSAAVETLRRLPRAIKGQVFHGLTAEAIKKAFTRAIKRAEIENFHFHDLRHEATSRLFEKGLNPMEVASITGHKTLQMLRRYTHLRAEDLARKLG
ncbi:MAG: integrase [Panacagrimonas sp.]